MVGSLFLPFLLFLFLVGDPNSGLTRRIDQLNILATEFLS